MSAVDERSAHALRKRSSVWDKRETPVSVRFVPEMIERLDRVASELSKVNANIRIGRSSVIKLALERALASLERELSLVSSDSALTRELLSRSLVPDEDSYEQA